MRILKVLSEGVQLCEVFLVNGGERVQIPLKAGHQRRFADGPMMAKA